MLHGACRLSEILPPPPPPSPPLHAASPNPWPRQVQHDVSDLSSAETLIEKASAAAGGCAVTILVNNAGLNVRKPAEALCAPPPLTKWTRRVPHPVLIGHAASLTPY